jgi:catechol 2,3-dioxygenase-like lactoylglutathione lyase family enzyme
MARSARSGRPHLTHVALWTSDVGRSIDFYCKHCKLEVVHDRVEQDGVRVAWIGESKYRSRFVIVLIARAVERSAPNSFAHFGFSCASRSDVDERAAAARSDGVLELEPRYGGPIVGYFCLLRDPDGNSVEFSFGQALGPGFSRAARRTGTPRRPIKPRGPRAG